MYQPGEGKVPMQRKNKSYYPLDDVPHTGPRSCMCVHMAPGPRFVFCVCMRLHTHTPRTVDRCMLCPSQAGYYNLTTPVPLTMYTYHSCMTVRGYFTI